MKITLLLLNIFLVNLCAAQPAPFQNFSVYFEKGSAELSRKDFKRVKEIYTDYKDVYQGIKIPVSIRGYTDSIGSSVVNDSLALKRARALGFAIKKVAPHAEVNYFIGERDSLQYSLPPDEQRRAEILPVTLCGFEVNLGTYTEEGVYAYANYLNYTGAACTEYGDYFAVTPLMQPLKRIAAGINALDKDDLVLHVEGMVDVSLSNCWYAPVGFDVFIPINGKLQDELVVYSKKLHEKENWKLTGFDVTYTDKHYKIHIPHHQWQGSICLGKPAGIKLNTGKVKYKTVYIATYKPFGFTNVSAASQRGRLSYSSAINDTLIAFTLPAREPSRSMIFRGYFYDANEISEIEVHLSRCQYKRERDGKEWYIITEESLLPKETKKKKDFWQWVKNLFN